MNDAKCSQEKWDRIFKKPLQGKPSEDRIADLTGESEGSPVSKRGHTDPNEHNVEHENLDRKNER
jgi:hypothetical protein